MFRVPLRWLGEYVDLTLPTEELARRLTMAGVEVGEIISSGGDWDGVRVAEVVKVERHPDPEVRRLTLVTVHLGDEDYRRVVCGAPNVAAGQKVAFAPEGTRLIDGHSGKPTVLKNAKIRGVESAGMVLSEKELGISDSHEGILELPAEAPVGEPLSSVFEILAANTRSPQDVAGDCTPNPRKESTASPMIAAGIVTVACTIRVESMFGKMCLARILASLAPFAIAART